MANDFSFQIVEDLGTIGEPTASGWETRLRKVSWNGRDPKYDIRAWSPDDSKMGKGISFSDDEFEDLKNIISNL